MDLGSGATADTANDHVLIQKFSSLGIVGSYYDRIAVEVVTSAGNINLGVYDDTGATVPNALLAETGAIAMPGNGTYTYQNITEFALTTQRAWGGMNFNSGSAQIARCNGGETIYFKQPVTGNVLTTPVSGFSTSTNPFRMKIKHS